MSAARPSQVQRSARPSVAATTIQTTATPMPVCATSVGGARVEPSLWSATPMAKDGMIRSKPPCAVSLVSDPP